MNPALIESDLTARYPDIIPMQSWGETAFFYNPGRVLKRGVYFATIKEKDGENDRASNLDREGLWRFNLGLPPSMFERQFGPRPLRPAKGGVIKGDYDFQARDLVMPHPVYGWMSWICVLAPSNETYAAIGEMIEAAFEKAQKTAKRRLKAAA